MKILLLLFLAAAFLFFGCTLAIPQSEQLTLKKSAPEYSQPSEYVCQEVDSVVPCSCMMCEKKYPWTAELLPFLKDWFDGSLKGGTCGFENCNAETYFDTLADKGDQLLSRTFMYGFGPSFASADAANLYCDYTLQLATKWMQGKTGPPRVPIAGRAMCWLDRNILPLYIYYTGGQFIDAGRTAQIAKAFDNADVGFASAKGAGPVMITTEAEFDSSDDAAVAAVRAQVAAIKNNCDKCLTVLAVKSGDTAALEKILGPPGIPTPEYAMVDAVGFGFRANDYPASYNCNIDKIINDNFQFSRYILSKYQKPSIWLYAGASQGSNAEGSCEFSAQDVHSFYQTIFQYTQGLASSGIMGVSFYEFTDQSGPLPCTDEEGCGFGVMSAGPDPQNPQAVQKHPELNTFARMCRYYGNVDYRSALVFSRNSYGTSCDFMVNTKMFRAVPDEINTDLGLDDSEVIPIEKEDKLNCGEVCVSETKLKKPEVYDETGNGFNSDHCGAFPVIDEYADDADFSATYYRAVVEQESGFDPLVVSCISTGKSGCNTGRPTDPQNGDYRNWYTVSEICAMAGQSGCHTASGAAECPSGQKPCAYGLAQCIEYPGNDPFGGKCGGSNYNPFNPANSVCCGINKMRDNLDESEKFLSDNWGQLSMCDEGMKDDERGWAAYYLASLRYFGLGYKGELSGFTSQRDTNGECTGEQHFIAYLRSLGSSSPPGYDYSAQIMSRYLDAVDNKCDSDCPGKA